MTTTHTAESKRVPRYLPASHSHIGPITNESGLTTGVILTCLLIFVFFTVAGIVLGRDCYHTSADTGITRIHRASSSYISSVETYRYKDRSDLDKRHTTLCTPTLVVNTVNHPQSPSTIIIEKPVVYHDTWVSYPSPQYSAMDTTTTTTSTVQTTTYDDNSYTVQPNDTHVSTSFGCTKTR